MIAYLHDLCIGKCSYILDLITAKKVCPVGVIKFLYFNGLS